MPGTEPLTQGEIARTLLRIEHATDEMRKELNQKLDARPTWADYKRLEQARDRQLADLEADVRALEANQSKVVWAIISTVIVTIMGVVINVDTLIN